ncbi:tetratricopeptide repeat protein [Roseofilum sp. BLCC_M154]|uniref:Tetratricopeptide repeat protein n=1 Tax=Roseofilum acuticapitatum BLCC-M154 TaxID=3022444 RepID=A0ABT7AUG5_9CYAN|nr:tetratricopeptide repeat protein [Roseofilum acuticapitatum]MDJ1170551.1 tetratricopeptide repeat protein [Roseofilum acuticapitatum BLCC-M154]
MAATGFIVIPENAPLYFCYRESEQANNIEVFQVPDDFYNHYIYGEKPSGDGVTLIKTKPYTYAPLTPELIAEKLDPLHPDRAIPHLKTQLAEQHRQHQTELDALQQSRSQLQQELTAANEQLHQKTTELATLKADYGQTQGELEQLNAYLQQTQGTAGIIGYYQHRIASDPDNLQLYHQALALDPNNSALHQQLGIALMGQQDFSQAILSFRRAIALNPHDGRSHHHLGDALAEMGKITEASQCYRRALDLQPQLANQGGKDIGQLKRWAK